MRANGDSLDIDELALVQSEQETIGQKKQCCQWLIDNKK